MTDPDGPVIEARGLVRRFEATVAVDGLDLEVARGNIFAVLGHNGAGKSTLLRLVNGLLRPHGGEIRVWGTDPYRDGAAVRIRTGVVTESTSLDEFLSVRETLRAYGGLFDVDRTRLHDRVEELLALFELEGFADQPARELSAGMRQRAAFARALVHEPELLLLDEPTANMDPVAAHRIRAVVAGLAREEHRTVLLSSHNLVEVQDICDHVAVLRRGRVLVQGRVDELTSSLAGSGTTRITVAGRHEEAIRALAAHGEVRTEPDGTLVVHASPDDVPRMVAALVAADVPVTGVRSVDPTIEDLYLELHREAVV